MRERFGLSCALTTPFDADGRVDAGLMGRHARWALKSGCSSVTLFGTTGEGTSIGDREKADTIAALLAGGIAGRSVVGAVASCSVEGAAAQARSFLDADARALLVTPPFYFKNIQDDDLFAWYSAVFAALGSAARDVILYNIPSVAVIGVSVALVARLRQAFPNLIVGVKDSSGDWAHTQALLADHRDISILIGDERSLAAGVRLGAEGAISGMANVMPDTLLALAHDGRDDERVVQLVNAVLTHPVTPAVKALTAERSGDAAWRRVRPPLPALSDAAARQLADLYRSVFAARAA